eukprot:gnl/MRDRNA2_/MRDRNA2_74938_c0_seq1.p1 gnl/MRDRNA2_/MRDRNA2_74938_c0~~gnl/MRDRNA2_/MRDRNA2_74938_c0_seq1.p1  ORF type:complete len:587 (-),score=122.50 gnl/MRDRNA2_/MRDRNA2_74938_c0_seq1:301-2061(-)
MFKLHFNPHGHVHHIYHVHHSSHSGPLAHHELLELHKLHQESSSAALEKVLEKERIVAQAHRGELLTHVVYSLGALCTVRLVDPTARPHHHGSVHHHHAHLSQHLVDSLQRNLHDTGIQHTDSIRLPHVPHGDASRASLLSISVKEATSNTMLGKVRQALQQISEKRSLAKEADASPVAKLVVNAAVHDVVMSKDEDTRRRFRAKDGDDNEDAKVGNRLCRTATMMATDKVSSVLALMSKNRKNAMEQEAPSLPDQNQGVPEKLEDAKSNLRQFQDEPVKEDRASYVAELETEKLQLKVRMEEMTTKLDRMKNQLQKEQAAHQQTKDRNEELQRKLEEMNAKQQGSAQTDNAELNALQSKLSAEQNAHRRTKSLNMELQQKIERMATDAKESVKTQLSVQDEQKGSIQSMKDELAKEQDAHQKTKALNKDFKQQLEESNSRIASLGSQLSSAKAQLARLKSQVIKDEDRSETTASTSEITTAPKSAEMVESPQSAALGNGTAKARIQSIEARIRSPRSPTSPVKSQSPKGEDEVDRSKSPRAPATKISRLARARQRVESMQAELEGPVRIGRLGRAMQKVSSPRRT